MPQRLSPDDVQRLRADLARSEQTLYALGRGLASIQTEAALAAQHTRHLLDAIHNAQDALPQAPVTFRLELRTVVRRSHL